VSDLHSAQCEVFDGIILIDFKLPSSINIIR
jgi:hypothetical protein